MPELESLIEIARNEISDEGIYEATQYLFDNFHNIYHKIVPEKFHNLPLEVAGAAIAGSFLVTKTVQKLSKKIGEIYPLVYEKALPVIERGVEIGIPIAALLYALIDPEGAEYWIYGKPMDNWGMFWAWFTGAVLVEYDMSKRPEEQKLSYIIKEALSKLKNPNL